MEQAELETLQRAFVDSMKEQYGSIDGRQEMMFTMIDAIRLGLMKERQEQVSFGEAADILLGEVKDVTASISTKENNVIFNALAKQFGFRP